MSEYLSKKYLNRAGFNEYVADLVQNPFTTLFYTPKIIHNLILRKNKPDFFGLGRFFDLLGIGLNTIFRDEEPKDRNWYSNYFLFGTWINALKLLYPTPNFPIFGKHFWGGVVGAFIQGFDNCKWQEEIGGSYPKAAAAVGFLNGVMCCAIQSACISAFNHFIPKPLEQVGNLLGFVTTWAISSKIMCNVEQLAFKGLEKLMPRKNVQTVSSPNIASGQPGDIPTPNCCCNQPTQPGQYQAAELNRRQAVSTLAK